MDFFKATEEAKHLNLLNKEDRVALFQKILGEKPQIKKMKIIVDEFDENAALPTAEQIREFWRADGLV